MDNFDQGHFEGFPRVYLWRDFGSNGLDRQSCIQQSRSLPKTLAKHKYPLWSLYPTNKNTMCFNCLRPLHLVEPLILTNSQSLP
mmetsp:Transcript_2522/g.9519  ORF Transcript_2522/g.9519 Transcript_2522/m.9519 type:complete len:84 (+) Transcript_2522:2117-2368(+)